MMEVSGGGLFMDALDFAAVGEVRSAWIVVILGACLWFGSLEQLHRQG